MLLRAANGSVGAAGRRLFSQQPTSIVTPYVYSLPLSQRAGVEVQLKLDALQQSGSFKDRGIGHLCEHLKREGATRLISSSGGNAGHAVANCGRILGMGVHVVVPTTTKAIMVDKIRAHGAEVQIHGANWNEADALARALVADDAAAEYVHPFDHPLIWAGHGGMVREMAAEVAGGRAPKPDAIVACVGGGGMLIGIYDALAEVGWADSVRVVSAETEGAASFARAFEAGCTPVTLDGIDSIATSLGALRVADALLERAAAYPGGTHAAVVSDAAAVGACERFADDHRLLVEPACGAALAVVDSSTAKAAGGPLQDCEHVAVVVCGGGGVTMDILRGWIEDVGTE